MLVLRVGRKPDAVTFSDQNWHARFGSMGDASESKFVESVDGHCERWGINRPEGVHVPSLPARVRAAPDYLTNQGFVECMGLGRAQHLQVKLEKWGVLRYWNDLMPVRVFVWDSHKKRSCLIGLDALDKIVQTPDAIGVDYFDGKKLVFQIPADLIFEAAS